MITDLNAEGEPLPIRPVNEEWIGHKVRTRGANIYMLRCYDRTHVVGFDVDGWVDLSRQAEEGKGQCMQRVAAHIRSHQEFGIWDLGRKRERERLRNLELGASKMQQSSLSPERKKRCTKFSLLHPKVWMFFEPVRKSFAALLPASFSSFLSFILGACFSYFPRA